ncbi:MarR family winged helix-turn-helix transcriptional regulator [Kribbella sp. DT2]|uniref:MarR family winged helix-turn-helix transcriptional regulator n=1 Tax=Kribbella sp. DT2 TaxID=3393427 RepID=UPI003CFBB31C
MIAQRPEPAAGTTAARGAAAPPAAGTPMSGGQPGGTPAAARAASGRAAGAPGAGPTTGRSTGRPPELIADVEQELSILLRRARSAQMLLARRVHPEMDAAGYALISQIDLGTAGGGAGVRASDVALALGLDKSTVSRGLSQLESLGLIERIGDPDDGRARLLRMTTAGADRYDAMRAQRQAEFRAILDRWDSTDLTDLARLLGRLNTDLS